MSFTAVQLTPLKMRELSEREYALWNELSNRLRAERLPEDPPVPLDETIRGWRNLPQVIHSEAWAIYNADESEMLAWGDVEFSRVGNNPHMVDFWIGVLPEQRRRGLATQILTQVAAVAQREQRRLLTAWTSERVPAGEAFMQRLGAKLGLSRHTNQLDLTELDRELVRQWQARAQQRAADFELGLWTGPYPEADLAAVVALNDAMNNEPHDGLEIEDYHKGPAEIRQWERAMFERGTERWTMYVREKSTGSIAGYTEVFWHPNRPALLNQGATGVLPAYRNKGLARWLKAAMLDKVLRERPQVRYIRTGNADSNAPMLKINLELGFKPYISIGVWQVETQQVAAYLGKDA